MTYATRIEAAWAAGLFEGEGTIGIKETRGRIAVRIALGTTDKDVLEKFQAVVGCGNISGPKWRELSTKPIWVWTATSHRDTKHVLGLILPFLGHRRRNAVERAWHAFAQQPEAWESKRGQTHCKRGHAFTPENTRVESTGSRRCLTCEKARIRRRRGEVSTLRQERWAA